MGMQIDERPVVGLRRPYNQPCVSNVTLTLATGDDESSDPLYVLRELSYLGAWRTARRRTARVDGEGPARAGVSGHCQTAVSGGREDRHVCLRWVLHGTRVLALGFRRSVQADRFDVISPTSNTVDKKVRECYSVKSHSSFTDSSGGLLSLITYH